MYPRSQYMDAPPQQSSASNQNYPGGRPKEQEQKNEKLSTDESDVSDEPRSEYLTPKRLHSEYFMKASSYHRSTKQPQKPQPYQPQTQQLRQSNQQQHSPFPSKPVPIINAQSTPSTIPTTPQTLTTKTTSKPTVLAQSPSSTTPTVPSAIEPSKPSTLITYPLNAPVFPPKTFQPPPTPTFQPPQILQQPVPKYPQPPTLPAVVTQPQPQQQQQQQPSGPSTTYSNFQSTSTAANQQQSTTTSPATRQSQSTFFPTVLTPTSTKSIAPTKYSSSDRVKSMEVPERPPRTTKVKSREKREQPKQSPSQENTDLMRRMEKFDAAIEQLMGFEAPENKLTTPKIQRIESDEEDVEETKVDGYSGVDRPMKSAASPKLRVPSSSDRSRPMPRSRDASRDRQQQQQQDGGSKDNERKIRTNKVPMPRRHH